MGSKHSTCVPEKTHKYVNIDSINSDVDDIDDTSCFAMFSSKKKCSKCMKKVKKSNTIKLYCCGKTICKNCNNYNRDNCFFCEKNDKCLICYETKNLMEMTCCKAKICNNCNFNNKSNVCWFCRQSTHEICSIKEQEKKYANDLQKKELMDADKMQNLRYFLKNIEEREKNTVIVLVQTKEVIWNPKYPKNDFNSQNIIKLVKLFVHNDNNNNNLDISLVEKYLNNIQNINFYIKLDFRDGRGYVTNILGKYLSNLYPSVIENMNFNIIDMLIKKGIDLNMESNCGEKFIDFYCSRYKNINRYLSQYTSE